MKIIFLVYSAAIECPISSALQKNGAKSYTKIRDVLGVGTHTEPRLDTNVWPGTNHSMFIALEEKKIPQLLKDLKAVKTEYKSEGVKAFVIPLEEIL